MPDEPADLAQCLQEQRQEASGGRAALASPIVEEPHVGPLLEDPDVIQDERRRVEIEEEEARLPPAFPRFVSVCLQEHGLSVPIPDV